MKYIDIHTHIIPNVDDGAESVHESLVLAALDKTDGAAVIFATPHSSAYYYHPEHTEESYSSVRQLCNQYLRDFDIYPGCEIYCEQVKMDSILEMLKTGQLPTMNHTNFVLIEFSQWAQIKSVEECPKALLDNGYIPIIAHAERYQVLWGKLELFQHLKNLGCMLQINLYSLQEDENPAIQNTAQELVKNRLVDFVGTDFHRTNHRPPSAVSGLAWLESHCDSEYTDTICWKNAEKLLLNSER